MKITINGNSQLIQANNLEDLLLELKYQGKLATALNENFIPLNERKKATLKAVSYTHLTLPTKRIV